MQRLLIISIGITLLLSIGLISCAPAAAPPIAPSALPTPPQIAPLPAPTLSPASTAWQQVVDAARKEGMVTIYSATPFAGEKGSAVAQAFKARYGITVEILLGTGRQLVERIKVEQNLRKPIGDMTAGGTSTAAEISELGLAAKAWPELPSFQDKNIFIGSPLFDPEGTILFMVFNPMGPMINTKAVKPEDEPRSYLDYLDPKWKGKILIRDPRSGGGGGFQWFSTMLAYKVLDEDYFQRFAKMAPQMWGGASTEEYKMVARGEYLLSPQVGNNSVGYLIVEGAPLKVLGMKEGNIVTGETITVLKQAAHPNAAKLFANWMFSQEGQMVYSKAASITPLRKDVPDFEHPLVQIKPQPGKLLIRTWDVSEESNRIHKAGIAERIFGKE